MVLTGSSAPSPPVSVCPADGTVLLLTPSPRTRRKIERYAAMLEWAFWQE
jgi:hypothetical protein